MKKIFKRRIYLDYAAAAPERARAARAYARAAHAFGNPSSIHADGVASAKVLSSARAAVAESLVAHADEIIFVGSGTESDNLAIIGSVHAAAEALGRKLAELHVVTTEIEHPAVHESCRALSRAGVAVTYLPVDSGGLVDLKELRGALRPETVLVSIAYANNEIGVLQTVKEIAKEIRHFKKQAVAGNSKREAGLYPLFHTDACQAAAYENLTVEQLGVDLLSLNGSKLGGPRGTGVLYTKRGTPLSAAIMGGGQEQGLRSGTENVPGAAALAAALTEAQMIRSKEAERLTSLRDFFFTQIEKKFPSARINGSRSSRLPNNVHVSFPGIASELLVLELDARGISASAGSACSAARDTGSHVLDALYGSDDEKKWGSVRFSFGQATTKRDILATLSALAAIFKKYQPYNIQG